MDRKKVGIIVGIIIAIIAIVAIFILGRDKIVDSTNNEIRTNEQIAKDIVEFNSNLDEEEVLETLETPLTEEQQAAFSEIVSDIYIPEVGEVVDADEETGAITYIDTDGNEVLMEINPEIINKSDEEAYQHAMELMEQLKREAAGEDVIGNPTDPGDIGGNPADPGDIGSVPSDVMTSIDDTQDWNDEDITANHEQDNPTGDGNGSGIKENTYIEGQGWTGGLATPDPDTGNNPENLPSLQAGS